LGELALKGKAEPIPAWEVVGGRAARTRLEVEAERGLTPLVGRERDLGALTDCFAKACAGHGQVVFIVGEAGIGKSRLLCAKLGSAVPTPASGREAAGRD
jgi:adenylate cyclase